MSAYRAWTRDHRRFAAHVRDRGRGAGVGPARGSGPAQGREACPARDNARAVRYEAHALQPDRSLVRRPSPRRPRPSLLGRAARRTAIAAIALLCAMWWTLVAAAQPAGTAKPAAPKAAPAQPKAVPAPPKGGPAQPKGAPQPPAQPAAAPATPDEPPAAAPAQPAAPAEPEVVIPTLPPSEAEQVRGQTIVKVDIAGNKRISEDEMVAYLGTMRVGKKFTPEGMSKDVHELYNSGFFDDVEVDLQRADQGVRLRVVVRERPSVKEINFSGASALETTDLTEALSVEVKLGSILSHPAIRRGIQKIRDKYAEKGYFLAEASYEVTPLKNNEVAIKFTIREHEAVTVRRVTFIGNHSIPDDELRDIMLTGQSSILEFGAGGPFRQDAFERDVLVINALYYDRGFLSVQVATPRVMLTPDRTGIEITLSINEGPRYKIRSLRVFERDADGKEIEPIGGRRALREMVRAKPGDFFNRAELAKDLQAVQTLYRDAGYANVDAPPETNLDPDTAEVDVAVPIRRNQLVYFGRVEIRGNTKTRDKVIRRELEIKERELFSETKLELSKRRVTSLGYFERVDISTEQGDDPEHVNVNIEITEKPTGTFQIGAGFSSIESFIATAQVQQANLFGNGQSLALQAQISGLRQLIDLRLFEPYFLDSVFSASFNIYDQLRVFNDFSQTSAGGSITFGYPLIQPRLRASLTYTLENNEISRSTTSTILGGVQQTTLQAFQTAPLSNLYNDGITSSLRPALTYDTRNNQLFPSAGTYLQASFEIAPDVFGTKNPFLRARMVGRYYHPITDGIVFKVNAEAGFVMSPNPQGVPLISRFFLGGIFDLRGFPLRSLGPRLPLLRSLDPNAEPFNNGFALGGNMMYVQNVELEFPILEAVQIRGVLFTDLGNNWNLETQYCGAAPGGSATFAETNPCFRPENLLAVRTSWGFGIRWFSPLGPLRFEWGFPFKPLPYEQSNIFEFTIGNFF
jgi:outer membrane protein insertion porin family